MDDEVVVCALSQRVREVFGTSCTPTFSLKSRLGGREHDTKQTPNRLFSGLGLGLVLAAAAVAAVAAAAVAAAAAASSGEAAALALFPIGKETDGPFFQKIVSPGK